MKEFDYTQVKHYKTYGFIKTVFRPLVKLVYKMRFKGLENIPKGRTNYIVAINHTCAVDPVFVALPKEVPPLHFMAKVELFKNPIAAWFMTRMYAFPVRRGRGDTSAIDYGVKIIEENHVMAICPEGRLFCDHSGATSHWPSWPLRRHLKLFVIILTHLTCPPFCYHQFQVPWLKAVTVQSAYIHRNS